MFISTFLFCKFSRKWDLQIYESISPVFRIDLGWKHSFISMVYRKTSSNQYLIRKFERFKSHRKLIIIIIPLRWWDTISRLHWMIEFQVWNAFQWNRKNGISPSFHRPATLDVIDVFYPCNIETRNLRWDKEVILLSKTCCMILTWCLIFAKSSRLNFIIKPLYDGKININLFESKYIDW